MFFCNDFQIYYISILKSNLFFSPWEVNVLVKTYFPYYFPYKTKKKTLKNQVFNRLKIICAALLKYNKHINLQHISIEY